MRISWMRWNPLISLVHSPRRPKVKTHNKPKDPNAAAPEVPDVSWW